MTRSFARLAWSNLVAQSAEQVALAAIPMLAVLTLGAGPAETGLLAGAQTLPFLLLSLPLGVLADRIARRRLMAGAEILRAAALAAVPFLVAANALSLPALAAIGALAATGTVAYSVAAPSLVPALVPRAALTAANARLELVRAAAFAAGPALAGGLAALTGASASFIVAASLSALAAVLLAGLAEPPLPVRARASVWYELREGAGFVWGHVLLRPILLTAVAWNVSWFVLQAVFMPYALGRLGLSPAAAGFTLAAYGAGMVAGAAAAGRLARLLPFGQMVAVGPFVSVAAAAVLAASLMLPGPAAPALAFALFGAGPIVWTIAQTTLRQAVTPPELLGRVSAVLTMATMGARPLGAALGGLVGGAVGPEAAILLAAAGFVVQATILVLSPVPRLAALPA